MKTAFSLLLLLHGIAHLVGFTVPWKLMESEATPYKTTVLSGHVDLGDAGIRVMGLLWLATALAFTVGAWTLWRGQAWAPSFVAGTAVFSLILSLLAWPDSRIGVVVNVLVLTALVFALGLG